MTSNPISPEDRIRQALKVTETGAMLQFDRDSQFSQALRDVLEKLDPVASGEPPAAQNLVADDPGSSDADGQGDPSQRA